MIYTKYAISIVFNILSGAYEDNMSETIQLYLEDNPNPVELLVGEFELKFKIDAATFINCYSNIFTKAALSRITGINERQLWHYAAGVHKPRKTQLEKIQNGIKVLTKELQAINSNSFLLVISNKTIKIEYFVIYI